MDDVNLSAQTTALSEKGTVRNSIEAAIIHKLVKERQGEAKAIIRPAPLPLDPPVVKLVTDIYSLYGIKTGKGYGRFEADELNFPSSRILREIYNDGKKTFLEASQELMSVLATKAGQAKLATGGYVVMAQGNMAGKGRWFLVAMITNVSASAIKDDSLEIVDSVHIDLQNLRVAGRVNLTDWIDEPKDVRYIGFLKQRNEVSEYFKLFLGCKEFIGSKEETKKLVKIVTDFAKKLGVDAEKQELVLKAAYDHCNDCRKSDQPINLEEFSNSVWPEDPKALQQALADNDIQLSDGFVPDQRGLKGLVKIRAKTPYWTVEIDRKAIVKGQAKYNPEDRTLIFTNLPKELEDELRTEISHGDI